MFLSLSSVEGSNGGSQNMITSTPRHSLIIIGNCPYVGGGRAWLLSCKAPLFLGGGCSALS
jgi:hypothetical protein